MLLINEKDKEYRFKTSGPKYLMRGPNIDFGVVKLLPGENFQNHLHERIEENFFMLEGEIDFTIDNKKTFTAKPGELVHVAPNESHYLINNGSTPAKAIFVKAPYDPDDKVNVDLD